MTIRTDRDNHTMPRTRQGELFRVVAAAAVNAAFTIGDRRAQREGEAVAAALARRRAGGAS